MGGDWFDVHTVARALAMPEAAIERLIANGHIHAVKVDGAWRVHDSELTWLIQRDRVGPG